MINKVTKVASNELLAMQDDLAEIRGSVLKSVIRTWNEVLAAVRARRKVERPAKPVRIMTEAHAD